MSSMDATLAVATFLPPAPHAEQTITAKPPSPTTLGDDQHDF